MGILRTVLTDYKGILSVSAARAGNLLVGFVLIITVSSLYDAVEQGLFYTFLSLASAQFFFDLGVGFTLANLAGRQAAKSEAGTQSGSSGSHDLSGVMRFACIWSAFSGFAMLVIIGTIGYFTLRSAEIEGISAIWIIYCALSCGLMIYNLFLRLYEGLGHVKAASFLRLATSSINVFLIMILGLLDFGISAMPMALTVALSVSVALAFVFVPEIRHSFGSLAGPKNKNLNWRRDILPFQRQVGLTWLSGYVVFQAQTPLLFWLEGAEAAGRFGMCVQVFQAINSTANIFLTYSIKPWTSFAVQEQQAALRRSFWRVTVLTMAVAAIGSVAVLLGFQLLSVLGSNIAERLSAAPIPWIYAVAVVANQFYFALSYYFRAYQKDPVWVITVIAACIILMLPLVVRDHYTELTASLSFLLVSVFVLCGGGLLLAQRDGLIGDRQA